MEREESMSQSSRGAIFELLSSMSQGTKVRRVFINGRSESVKAFVSFDEVTNLVTFEKEDYSLLLVDYQNIDAVKLN
jgi:hypothetical protein